MIKKTKKVDNKDVDGYMYEVTSRYHEQLQELNIRKDKIKRLLIFYVFSVLVIGVFAIYLVGNSESQFTTRLAIPLLGVYGGLIFAIFYLQYSGIQSKISQTLTRMRLQEKLQGFSEGHSETGEDEEYFERLVHINIENLSAYYEQVKGHANKSFVASLVMSVIGFSIIVVGLIVSFNSEENQILLIFVSAASGVITEAIAALFFLLYTKTVHQMKEYHDGLLYVQNILLSLKLIEGIDGLNVDLKTESINKAVEYLLSKSVIK